jgi:tetratricopeptide (TPR) repeat protein
MIDTSKIPVQYKPRYRARVLKSLGMVYKEKGDIEQALEIHEEDAQICLTEYGENNPEYLLSLQNIANDYHRMLEFEIADSIFNQIYAKLTDIYPPNHPKIAQCLFHMAEISLAQNHIEDALEYSKRAYQIRSDNYAELVRVLNEENAIKSYKGIRLSGILYLNSLLMSNTDIQSNLQDAADLIVGTKGTVSDEMYDRKKWFSTCDNDSLKSLYGKYYGICKELAYSRVLGIGTTDTISVNRVIDSLIGISKEYELQLARGSAKFRTIRPVDRYLAQDVVEALPPKSTIIEFFETPVAYPVPQSPIEWQNEYLAMIISNLGPIEIVRIGECDRINSLISDYRNHFARVADQSHLPSEEDNREYKAISKKLFDTVWRPITRYVGNEDILFIAPDGDLNLISFAALVDDEDEYIIRKHNVHYTSSARDIIKLDISRGDQSGLLAIGGPDYDANPNEQGILSLSTSSLEEDESDADNRTRGLKLSCEQLGNLNLAPLHNSGEEVKHVAGIWESSFQKSAQSLIGIDATEANFRNYSAGNEVIHISTHGFYLLSSCGRPIESAELYDQDMYVDNPLTYSGLFFAGANRALDEKLPPENDGIITASVSMACVGHFSWLVLRLLLVPYGLFLIK